MMELVALAIGWLSVGILIGATAVDAAERRRARARRLRLPRERRDRRRIWWRSWSDYR